MINGSPFLLYIILLGTSKKYPESIPLCAQKIKTADIFLTNVKIVDMFPEPKVRTGRNVDMFLPAILRIGERNDYLFHFLKPYRISGFIDSSRGVTMILLNEKVTNQKLCCFKSRT